MDLLNRYFNILFNKKGGKIRRLHICHGVCSTCSVADNCDILTFESCCITMTNKINILFLYEKSLRLLT